MMELALEDKNGNPVVAAFDNYDVIGFVNPKTGQQDYYLADFSPKTRILSGDRVITQAQDGKVFAFVLKYRMLPRGGMWMHIKGLYAKEKDEGRDVPQEEQPSLWAAIIGRIEGLVSPVSIKVFHSCSDTIIGRPPV